jgi:cell division inhibitor SulA
MNGINLPDVSEALDGIGAMVKLRVVAKAVQDFEIVEREQNPIIFLGVIIPILQKLDIKAEGQRRWKGWTIFTKQLLELDWMVEDPFGTKLRVLDREQWGSYLRYTVVENPLT